MARSRRTSAMLVRRCCPEFFDHSARELDLPPRYALDGYGIIFSCPITIFYHHVSGKLLIASANGRRRGPSASRYKPFFTRQIYGALRSEAMTFGRWKGLPALQPHCPSATVLSPQPPSPICHPDRSAAEGRDLLCAIRATHMYPSPALYFFVILRKTVLWKG